jgi:hypothetical protein
MKKEKLKLGIYTAALTFLTKTISLVSAADGNAFDPNGYLSVNPDRFVVAFMEWIKSTFGVFFAAILGVNDSNYEFLFGKILIFFLLFAVIFLVLKRIDLFKANRPVLVLVTSIVSILAVRYMQESDFITGVLLPYGALGGAITMLLPLIIFSAFVQTSIQGSMFRRVAWCVYGAVFFTFWVMRYDQMNPSGNLVYYLGIGFIILNVLFDKQIRAILERSGIEKAMQTIDDRALGEALVHLKNAEESGDPNLIRRARHKVKSLSYDIGY